MHTETPLKDFAAIRGNQTRLARAIDMSNGALSQIVNSDRASGVTVIEIEGDLYACELVWLGGKMPKTAKKGKNRHEQKPCRSTAAA